nr:hypothetical protein [Lysobacter enzymogenes]
MQRTLQPLPGQPPMGMNWMLLEHGGRTLAEHAGGTGGFSSYLALDRARGRAVVVLSDTSLSATGGLAGFGRHLLDPDFPAERARKAATPDAALLDRLAGDYSLAGLPTTLRRRGGALTVQAQGQPEFELGYDDHGDFYPLQFDALLRRCAAPMAATASCGTRAAAAWRRSAARRPPRRCPPKPDLPKPCPPKPYPSKPPPPKPLRRRPRSAWAISSATTRWRRASC